MPVDPAPGLILALDGLDEREASDLARRLSPRDCRLKVGSELFVKSGPGLVRDLQEEGFDIFLDLKFNDIPNTVAAACRAVRELGVWMCTVHASGGPAMLEAARDAARPGLKVVAVTVLTSMDDEDLDAVGQGPADSQVARLAQLARRSRLAGIVCSACEARQVRRACGPDFWIITPGVRPAAAPDDQKRTVTPKAAAAAGANYLVIGRPIVQADDPPAAVHAILEELSPKAGRLEAGPSSVRPPENRRRLDE